MQENLEAAGRSAPETLRVLTQMSRARFAATKCSFICLVVAFCFVAAVYSLTKTESLQEIVGRSLAVLLAAATNVSLVADAKS